MSTRRGLNKNLQGTIQTQGWYASKCGFSFFVRVGLFTDGDVSVSQLHVRCRPSHGSAVAPSEAHAVENRFSIFNFHFQEKSLLVSKRAILVFHKMKETIKCIVVRDFASSSNTYNAIRELIELSGQREFIDISSTMLSYDIHRNHRYGAESIEEIAALARTAYAELTKDFRGKIILIGHSMGALVCRLMLSSEKIRPDKTVFLNPFWGKPPPHSSTVSQFRRMALVAKCAPACIRKKLRMPVLIDPGGHLYPGSPYFRTSPITNLLSTACFLVHKGNFPPVFPTGKIFIIFSQGDGFVAENTPDLQIFSCKSIENSYHAHFDDGRFREAFLRIFALA
jgi:pimeloyl-ACP methyl ester carboxylesterase